MGGAGTKTAPPKRLPVDVREPRTTWFRGSREILQTAVTYQRWEFMRSDCS
ncbi:hypothetical protein GCM10011609_83100 [Lentzea pudingi]|uniref:Uncharacterized protein n=1 Tax=Lentzea pudingi TaxID=1789439 RepID=A0ABQ2IUP1_9PSEU|nr:hypothetical protein GCM10011609_83100 [Lentzea pudingi]